MFFKLQITYVLNVKCSGVNH